MQFIVSSFVITMSSTGTVKSILFPWKLQKKTKGSFWAEERPNSWTIDANCSNRALGSYFNPYKDFFNLHTDATQEANKL